jgi:type II secretory pathway component PulF
MSKLFEIFYEKDNKAIKTVVSSENFDEARKDNKHLKIIKIKEIKKDVLSQLFHNKSFVSVNLDKKISLLKSINFYVSVGYSSGQALALVIEMETSPNNRALFQDALDNIQKGGTFGESVNLMRIYSDDIVSLLQTGEMINIKQAIEDAITLLEKRKKGWGFFYASISVVVFDFFMAISTSISVQTYAIPFVKDKMSSQGLTVEQITALSQKVNMVEYLNMSFLVLMFGMVAIFVFFIVYFVGATRNQKAELLIHFNKVALIRRVLIDLEVSTSLTILGRMINNGIALNSATKLLAKINTTGMHIFWERFTHHLEGGDGVMLSSVRSKLFLKEEIIAINSHQNSHQLSLIFTNIANNREQQAETGMKKITILVTWLMTASILISMLLAMWLLFISDSGVSSSMDTMMNSM